MNRIAVNNLPQINHENMPVITTELLAKLYEVKPKNITDNFANNIERFIEGKHYFKLEGSKLKAFKNCTDNIGLVNKRARNLILWTERGSARHAKMITSDQAWEVFEKLEDHYFSIAKRTTSKQREIFINACDKLAINNKLRSKVYTDVANHFGYEKPVDMPIDILPEAIAYVYEELLAQEKARKSEEKPSIIHQDAQVALEIGYHANNEAWQYIKGLENELKSALSMISKLGNLNQITGSNFADIEVGIPCSLDQRRKGREIAGYAIENYREKGMMSLAYKY